MPKKKLKETHGKATENFTRMDQLWGDTGAQKYGTMDEHDYLTEINSMSSTDLAEHARKQGFVATGNREALINKLLSEFRKHVQGYIMPPTVVRTEAKVPKEVEKILAEGR